MILRLSNYKTHFLVVEFLIYFMALFTNWQMQFLVKETQQLQSSELFDNTHFSVVITAQSMV